MNNKERAKTIVDAWLSLGGKFQTRQVLEGLIENEMDKNAAPELLEALERILADEEVALSRPDFVFAHAAIAKAKGETE